MLKYGIIGLGNLGEKIARNLINKGFSVKIFDKDQKNINKLVKLELLTQSLFLKLQMRLMDLLLACHLQKFQLK